jgi:PAS domain S-box-containing protein
MFQVSRDLLWIAGLDGSFRRVNPAFERTLGYSSDQLLSLRVDDLVVHNDVGRVHDAITRLAGGEEVVEFEARVVRADGVARRLELNARPIVGEGAFYAAARDVTERRRTEHELQQLAEEHAALRRVATLVAQAAPPSDVLESVVREARRLLGATATRLYRYDGEESATVVADDSAPGFEIPAGTTLRLEGDNIPGVVWRTGAAARIHRLEDAAGPLAARLRGLGIHGGAGAPIVVEGGLWGVLVAGWTKEIVPAGADAEPVDTETRLYAFTELVASAISNTEFRDGLRRLADEQVALRRVATLVAEGATAEELFTAVVDEVAEVLNVPAVVLNRFDADRFTVVAATLDGSEPALFRVGTSWPLDAPGLSPKVFETAGPVRIDDYSGLAGPTAQALRESFVSSSVGVPITVDGVLWGAMCVATINGPPLPSDTEVRLRDFTDLVGTAISNIQARQDLSVLAGEQASLRRVATLVAGGATSA